MVGVLVVVAVWSLCLVAILRLRYEVTRTRLPSPDKWEPGFLPGGPGKPLMYKDVLELEQMINNANRALSDYSDWSVILNDHTPLTRRCIHVEVLPGHESEAAEEVLRADLDLAREGL